VPTYEPPLHFRNSTPSSMCFNFALRVWSLQSQKIFYSRFKLCTNSGVATHTVCCVFFL